MTAGVRKTKRIIIEVKLLTVIFGCDVKPHWTHCGPVARQLLSGTAHGRVGVGTANEHVSLA